MTEHLDDALHRAEQAITEAKAAEQAVEAKHGLPEHDHDEPESPLSYADAESPDPGEH